jgi:hypothetical protein
LALDLWETVVMAKVPKVGEAVYRRGSPVTYMVIEVNASKKTADIKSTKGGIVLYKDVLWAELEVLDESQNALRIVRQATEDK